MIHRLQTPNIVRMKNPSFLYYYYHRPRFFVSFQKEAQSLLLIFSLERRNILRDFSTKSWGYVEHSRPVARNRPAVFTLLRFAVLFKY